MKIGFVDVTGREGANFGWDLIRWFQDSPIVHVFAVIDNDVYETTSTVYLKRSLQERAQGCTLRLFDVGGDDAKAKQLAESFLGTPYGYPEIIGLGIFLLAERLFNWIFWPIKKLIERFNKGKKLPPMRLQFVGNPYDLKQTMYCAEATHKVMQEAGIFTPQWWTSASLTAPQMYGWFIENSVRKRSLHG